MGYIYCKEKNGFIKTLGNKRELPQIVWHITDKCRLNCQYCFATRSSIEADVSKMDAYVGRLKELGVQKIDISGGEPLEHCKLPKICTSLYQNGFYITLTTKGIGLDENIQWLEQEYGMFSRIIFSIDVPSEEEQRNLVGTDEYNTFDSIRSIMEYLAERDYGNIRINTVVTQRLLLEGNIEKMAALVNGMGCREWCLIQPHPANKKEKFNEIAVESVDFTRIIDAVKNKSMFKGTLLYRYAENYRDYWVLYPGNHLAKHTMDSDDIYNFDFFRTPVSTILSEVMKNKIWIQEEKSDE